MIAELQRTKCRPSGYGEYDNLTGYVDRTYSVEWEDAHGNTWRKTCTVINLGRPDRGIPVDPDNEMSKPIPPADPRDGGNMPMMRRAERVVQTQEIVVDYLTRNGMTSAKDMARPLGISRTTLIDHLHKRDTIYFRKRDGRAILWGLRNVHDQSE